MLIKYLYTVMAEQIWDCSYVIKYRSVLWKHSNQSRSRHTMQALRMSVEEHIHMPKHAEETRHRELILTRTYKAA
jgi:hypothetical protein